MSTAHPSSKTSRNEPLDVLSTHGKKSLRVLAREKPESWWLDQGEKKALKLFHEAAKRVPAYKAFLAKQKVNPRSIHTIDDFKKVPPTDKKNYILKYPLADRCWDGNLSTNALIAASSGTTGEPTLWPRGREQEQEALEVHEQLFLDLYEIEKFKTLVVVGFPMGIYISGIATALPMFLASIRHKNLTLVTPGNNKDSVLKIIPSLQNEFQQIVLVGHPFFIKDVIETGKAQKINWSKTKVRTFFCSEGFSEDWRGYMSSQLKASSPYTTLFNTYGSSELLLMAYESPETILLKEKCEESESLSKELFGRTQAPYIFQYNPVLRYIESDENGELLFTANAGIPLIRFNLHDSGVVIDRKHLESGLKKVDVHVRDEKSWKKWNYPFVALFGRSDYTLVFYAANIYPENIHKALSHRDSFGKLTGKFQMEKKMSGNMEQHLLIHIELKQGVKPSSKFAKIIQKRVLSTLETENMEYKFLRNNLQKDLVPKVVLYAYQDPERFKPGLKPRYID